MISRTRLQLNVRYSAEAFNCRRVLRVLPLQRANQHIQIERLQISPAPELQAENFDRFGNRRLHLFHRSLREFQLELKLETRVVEAEILVDEANLGVWKMPSRAIRFAPEFGFLSKEARRLEPLERAIWICAQCFETLEYRPETDDSPPEAREVWLRRFGNCADFTHVFLTICRMSGLAARYVAGFNPGEGQMHAWAEVRVGEVWRAFDPTHGRAPSPGCVAVAMGRDFHDTAPTRATFRGEASAQLRLSCRTECVEG